MSHFKIQKYYFDIGSKLLLWHINVTFWKIRLKKLILFFGWKKFWMKIPRIVSLMCNCLMVYYQLVCSRLACQSPTQSKYEEFSIKSKMQKRHSTWPNMLKERMCKHLIAKREFIFWRKRLRFGPLAGGSAQKRDFLLWRRSQHGSFFMLDCIAKKRRAQHSLDHYKAHLKAHLNRLTM